MKVRTLAVLVVGALFVTKAPAAEPEKGKTDADRIQATWLPVSLEKEGKKAPQEVQENIKITFAADGKGTVQEGGRTEEFRYALDPAKKLKEITVTVRFADGEEKVYKGIYKLEGDTLTICVTDGPEDRPTDFTTPEGSKRQLIVLKRDTK
jgi:uncharacterized protein (TIGR03067 family)